MVHQTRCRLSTAKGQTQRLLVGRARIEPGRVEGEVEALLRVVRQVGRSLRGEGPRLSAPRLTAGVGRMDQPSERPYWRS